MAHNEDPDEMSQNAAFHQGLHYLLRQHRLVVTCWERVDLLALLYVMFSCVFATNPYGVHGQVWYLIV